MPVPVHVTLHDMAGRDLVIECVDGKLHMYDNPTVMTKAPDFPWQLAHLGLYGPWEPGGGPVSRRWRRCQ
jgi:choloylglycine hydrolase